MDLERYKNGYSDLLQAIEGLREEEMQFKPDLEKWSIHEILVHLADTEAQSYVRIRTILADTPAMVMNHDQMTWSKALRYQETGIAEALAILEVLRKANYILLAKLSPAEWQKEGTHSVRGRLSLETLIKIYTDHIPKHIGQIQRNLAAYQQRGA